MRYVTAALRWFLFLVFFLFALKNHELVSLRFYFDLEWKLPLVLLLFVFFLAGAVIGLLALLPRVMRQRREINTALAEVKGLREPGTSKRAGAHGGAGNSGSNSGSSGASVVAAGGAGVTGATAAVLTQAPLDAVAPEPARK